MRFLENKLFPYCLDGINLLLQQLSPQGHQILTQEQLTKMIVEDGWLSMLCDEEKQEVIGIAMLTCACNPTNLFFGKLEKLIVDEKHRGKGYGVALVRLILSRAKKSGMHFVDAVSNPNRLQANQLFTDLGAKRRRHDIYRFKL